MTEWYLGSRNGQQSL